jgi:hypothetical protein
VILWILGAILTVSGLAGKLAIGIAMPGLFLLVRLL